MIAGNLFWRAYLKDRIFIALALAVAGTFIAAIVIRQPRLESSPVPFELATFFLVVNSIFAIVALPREPLLSYMFLTATILTNGTLFFYLHYLVSLQAV